MSIISEVEFYNLLKKLEFALDIKPGNEQIKVIYDRLKNTSERMMIKAIDYIIDTYSNKYNKFPQVSDFMEAIKEVSRDLSEPTQQDLVDRDETFTCQVCWGEGRYIDEKKSPGGTEVFCQCKKGQRLYENRQAYFQMKRIKYYDNPA